MSPPEHFIAQQFRSYIEQFGQETFRTALGLVGEDTVLKEPGAETALTEVYERYGYKEVLSALGVLGLAAPELRGGSEFFAVSDALKRCKKREIGENEEESKTTVQARAKPPFGNQTDRIELINAEGNTVYTWTWHGPKKNQGAKYTGKLKGKFYLHFKGRDNAQNAEWDVNIVS